MAPWRGAPKTRNDEAGTMKKSRWVYLGGVLAVALTLVACADGTGPDNLDDAIVMDVALIAVDGVLEEVTLWSGPMGFGGAPAAVPGVPGGRGGFSGETSGTREVTFYNEDGLEQAAYDALTTESIHIVHEVSGSITRDNMTAEIERSREMTVSGLAGEEVTRTWNGSGSTSVDGTGVRPDGGERSHSVRGASTFADVVVPVPGSESRYPLSGTVTHSMVGTWTTPEGTRTREVEIVITFNGTAVVVALVNGDEVEIDLSTDPGRNPLRRR